MNGLLVEYLQADPNNSSQYAYAFYANHSTRRFSVRSDGGIDNYQAYNTNLSDLSVKKDFALYSSSAELTEKVWNFGKRMRSAWGHFRYKDQTHGDLNNGYGAQYVKVAAGDDFPELTEQSEWSKDKDDNPVMRLSVYDSDLMHLMGANVTECQYKIDELRAEFDAYKLAHP